MHASGRENYVRFDTKVEERARRTERGKEGEDEVRKKARERERETHVCRIFIGDSEGIR